MKGKRKSKRAQAPFIVADSSRITCHIGAAGVAPGFPHGLGHSLDDCGLQRCGGVVIHVDLPGRRENRQPVKGREAGCGQPRSGGSQRGSSASRLKAQVEHQASVLHVLPPGGRCHGFQSPGTRPTLDGHNFPSTRLQISSPPPGRNCPWLGAHSPGGFRMTSSHQLQALLLGVRVLWLPPPSWLSPGILSLGQACTFSYFSLPRSPPHRDFSKS